MNWPPTALAVALIAALFGATLTMCAPDNSITTIVGDGNSDGNGTVDEDDRSDEGDDSHEAASPGADSPEQEHVAAPLPDCWIDFGTMPKDATPYWNPLDTCPSLGVVVEGELAQEWSDSVTYCMVEQNDSLLPVRAVLHLQTDSGWLRLDSDDNSDNSIGWRFSEWETTYSMYETYDGNNLAGTASFDDLAGNVLSFAVTFPNGDETTLPEGQNVGTCRIGTDPAASPASIAFFWN